MSRRNRHLLESSPLPPLPEVDTSSTIESPLSRDKSHASKQHHFRNRAGNSTATVGGSMDPIHGSASLNTDDRQLQQASVDYLANEVSTAKLAKRENTFYEDVGKQMSSSSSHNDFFRDIPFNPGAATSFNDLQKQINVEGFQDIPLEEKGKPNTSSRSTMPFQSLKVTFATLISPSSKDRRTFNASQQNSQPDSGPSLVNKNPGRAMEKGQVRLKPDLDAEFEAKITHQQQYGSSVYGSSPPIVQVTNQFMHSQQADIQQDSNSLAAYRKDEKLVTATANIQGFLQRPYQLPRRRTKSSVADDVSIPDGSTVGNIYKHYLRDDPLTDFSDDGSLSDLSMNQPEVKPSSPSEFSSQQRAIGKDLGAGETKPMTFRERLQFRTGNSGKSDPPQFPLPVPPSQTQKSNLGSTFGQALGHAGSYGAKHMLSPDYVARKSNARNSLTHSEICLNLHFESSEDTQERVRTNRPLNSRNPFRVAPKLVIGQVDGDVLIYHEENMGVEGPPVSRLPLEREVSDALRRASGISTYSAGSVTDSIVDRYRYFGQKTFPPQNQNLTCSSEQLAKKSEDLELKFYNTTAVPSDWIHGQEGHEVRVPIDKSEHWSDADNDGRSSFPPNPTQAAINISPITPITRSEDENNDWETVGTRTSVLGANDFKPKHGFGGGMIGRTGSSIADTSDGGFGSMIEIDDLRSTQRIAQHPAHQQYQAEYYQRTLKDTKAPIFAPKYRVHKINGFLANSSRLQPQPSDVGGSPQVLDRSHLNPFQQPPPQVLFSRLHKSKVGPVKTASSFKESKPSMQTLNTEIGEEDYTREIELPSLLQPLSAEERKKKTMEWMENFDRHKLAVDIADESNPNSQTTNGSSPSSLQRAVETVGRSLTNIFGEYNQQSQKPQDTKLRTLKLPAKLQADGATDTRTRSGTSKQGNFLKTHEINQKGQFHGFGLLKESQFLTSSQPSTPHAVGKTGSDNFTYRSPLAPPKRGSWKILYSPSQLFGFKEAARADGIGTHNQLTSSYLSEQSNEGNSRKHLYERPSLRLWKRDEATRTDLTHQKTHCSIVVLLLCTLFPPLLLLYIFGGLDGVISWWTKGHYTSFAKSQKRLALVFLIAWSIAVFVGMIVFLVYWFTRLRQD